MKMSKIHYAALKAKVVTLMPKINAHKEALKDNAQYVSLQKRLLWDVFHATKIYHDYSYQEFDYLDSHIETAMKSIFRELGINAN